MIRLAGTRASRAVRSTTRCHSASVSGGISGNTVVTAAVPMTTAAGRCAKGPESAAPARAASPGGGAAWPGPVHAAGRARANSRAEALQPLPAGGPAPAARGTDRGRGLLINGIRTRASAVQRGISCLRTIEEHMGRIPESIWGTAPYRSGRGGDRVSGSRNSMSNEQAANDTSAGASGEANRPLLPNDPHLCLESHLTIPLRADRGQRRSRPTPRLRPGPCEHSGRL